MYIYIDIYIYTLEECPHSLPMSHLASVLSSSSVPLNFEAVISRLSSSGRLPEIQRNSTIFYTSETHTTQTVLI